MPNPSFGSVILAVGFFSAMGTSWAGPAPVVASTAPAVAASQRPSHWAQAIKRPGLPNLFKVSDRLYRGAQPAAEGIKQLPGLGVTTIVNLRDNHSDRKLLADAQLDYVEIPMNTWAPKQEDVIRFLRIVASDKGGPVFVHCQHGADRTGMMAAVYRVVVQGWSKQEAVEEMTQGGFGYHRMWKRTVSFVMDLDAQELREKAGLKTLTPQGGQHG